VKTLVSEGVQGCSIDKATYIHRLQYRQGTYIHELQHKHVMYLLFLLVQAGYRYMLIMGYWYRLVTGCWHILV
jgi:hypothetical protein